MRLSFGFSGPKIEMRGVLPPEASRKPSNTLGFGLFWSIYVSSGVVLQNSAAYQCTCLEAQKKHETRFCNQKDQRKTFL